MPSKRPVLIGSVTVDPENGDPNYTVDIIVNVTDALWQIFGSPTIDPAKLEGTTRTGPNGDYRFPKNGTRTGSTITLFTDQQTPGGKPATRQMQLPWNCPLHVLDKFLVATTFVGENITAFKRGGGIRIPVGQTAVS